MRPLNLTIEGIQSFQDEQVIDFARVSKSGLFGIFGATGSGKSTILDALMLALFGEIERSKARNDFINQSRDSARVTFLFEMTDLGQSHIFYIERKFKQRKSGMLHEAWLYEIKGEQRYLLAEQPKRVGEQIFKQLGLSAEEFKKCIALPQGEFATFLKATRAVQMDIVGKLFSLERYGTPLMNHVNESVTKGKTQMDALQAEIEACGEVKNEVAEQLKMKEAECVALLKVHIVKQKALAKAKITLQQKFDQQEKLMMVRKAYQELVNKKDTMLKNEQKIERAGLANHLYPLLNRAELSTKEEKSLSKLVEKQQIETNNLEEKYIKLKNESVKKQENAAQELKMAERKRDNLKDNPMELNRYEKLTTEVNDEIILYKAEKKDLAALEKEVEGLLNEQLKWIEQVKRVGEKRKKAEDNLKEYYACELQAGKQMAFGEVRAKIQEDKPSATKEVVNYIEGLETYIQSQMSNSVGKMTGDKTALEKDNSDCCEEEKTILRQQSELAVKIENKQGLINNKKIVMESILAQGKRAREDQKNVAERLSALNIQLDVAYDKQLEMAESEVEKKKKAKEGIEFELENSETESRKSKETLLSLQAQANQQRETARQDSEELNIALRKNGFVDGQDVRNEFCTEGELKGLQDEVKQYSHMLVAAETELKQFVGVEVGETVTQEEINQSNTDIEKVENDIQADYAAQAKVSEELKSYQARKMKALELGKKYRAIEAKQRLNEVVKQLVKDRSLMEYAAAEFFTEITVLATKLLQELTNGRYVLLYRDKFWIEDNLNEGKEREVGSLSGGETFLVSLALAVALSETIVNLSARPLDFFFLDEGFGTLDSELLDIVMDSLERLKTTHFTIGLITHVPEMQQRITSRILVSGATESHGTLVRMEIE